MNKDFKDFVEFREKMYDTPKEDELWVGGRNGHSRAMYNFAGYRAFYEQIFPFNPFKESREWWWTDMEIVGKEKAQETAEYYNAEIQETFYGPDDAWHLVFESFDDLIHLFYDRLTGSFKHDIQII